MKSARANAVSRTMRTFCERRATIPPVVRAAASFRVCSSETRRDEKTGNKPIEACGGEEGDVFGTERANGDDERVSQQESGAATAQGDEAIFGEQLAREPDTAGSEGATNGHFGFA